MDGKQRQGEKLWNGRKGRIEKGEIFNLKHGRNSWEWEENSLIGIKSLTILMMQCCPELVSTLPLYLYSRVNAIFGLIIVTIRIANCNTFLAEIKQVWKQIRMALSKAHEPSLQEQPELFQETPTSHQIHGLMLEIYPELQYLKSTSCENVPSLYTIFFH